ncbi:MAG: hypothetical protein ACI87W_001770 [Halieaceae bacterium]
MKRLEQLQQRYRSTAEPLRSERRLELALLFVAALLLVQLLWFGVRWMVALPVDPMAPTEDSLRVVERMSPGSISAEQSLQLQTRPIFWPSRRPVENIGLPEPQESVAGNETAAAELEGLLLTGLFGGGEFGGAIVAYKGNRQRILVGEEIDGWSLQSIGSDAVVFESGGVRDERRLTLAPVIAITAESAEAEMTSAETARLIKDARSKKSISSAALRAADESRSLSMGG